MTGSLMTMKNEYEPSKFTRDRKLFELYKNWHQSYFKSEPSSQQIIVSCEWASYLLSNPPQKDD